MRRRLRLQSSSPRYLMRGAIRRNQTQSDAIKMQSRSMGRYLMRGAISNQWWRLEVFGATQRQSEANTTRLQPNAIKTPSSCDQDAIEAQSRRTQDAVKTQLRCNHVPGAPPVVSAGPLFPAEVTKITPCLSTARWHISVKRPVLSRLAYSPNERLMMCTPAPERAQGSNQEERHATRSNQGLIKN